MQMKVHGWIGLAVMAMGLSIVGMSLLTSHPGATGQHAGKSATPDINGGDAPAQDSAAEPAAPGPVPGAPQAAAPTGPAPQVVKRILPIAGPLRYGDWHWDEAGVPPGPLVITVDLEARVLSVFRGGYEIAATAVLLGTTDKPTPTGLFPISEKDADHKSNIYDGAPMPYMLRLTNDGVTIHGTRVQNGYASHGCVGVPTPFAKKLFGIAALGTPVYITRGKMIGLGDSLTG
ncbi:MAG TPA: L,D-transpeptidase family protein [Novosphingobium sp.]